MKRCEPAGGKFVKNLIKEDIFKPVVEKIVEEFNTRFSDTVINLYECTLAFMPSNIKDLTEQHIDSVTQLYPGDFTDDEVRACKGSLFMFKAMVATDMFYSEQEECNKGKKRSLQDVMIAMMKYKLYEDHQYPVMFKIYQLLLVLPISSASSERSFSALKLMKTRLRTTMSNTWLNNLILLFVNKNLARRIQPEEVVRRWYLKGKDKNIERNAEKYLAKSDILNENRKGRRERVAQDKVKLKQIVKDKKKEDKKKKKRKITEVLNTSS